MEDLSFYIVTFNCGRSLIEVSPFAHHLLDGWEHPNTKSNTTAHLPDALILTLQEFAPLSYAFLGGNLVKPYFDRFRSAVPLALQNYAEKHEVDADEHEYINITSRNNGLTAVMVFAKKSLVARIATLQVAEVGVGVAEMGNKGAVGVRIGWDVQRDGTEPVYTTFVGAHLAPFEAEVQKRDQDYVDIVKGITFERRDVREWRKEAGQEEDVPLLSGDGEGESDGLGSESGEVRGMYCDDSYLFFSGDLNYRTALTGPGREDSKTFPRPNEDLDSALHYRNLLDKDQLQQQLKQGKTLHGLTEQPIDFPPTYKYHVDNEKPVLRDDDVDEWSWAKHRWPSWCDRILFSRTDFLPVKAGKYSALPIFRTSDHRPVTLCVSVPAKAVKDSSFPRKAPAPIDQQCRSRRTAARRKEIIVGLVAYLGLTWEGRSLILGAILVVVGGYFMLKNMP